MSRALTSIASCVTVPRTAAQDAAQDLRVALTLAADGHTWREIARAAIHRLAAAHVAHVRLQARYARLLEAYRNATASRGAA